VGFGKGMVVCYSQIGRKTLQACKTFVEGEVEQDDDSITHYTHILRAVMKMPVMNHKPP